MLDDDILLNLYAATEVEGRWTAMLDGVCEALSVRSAVVQVIEEAETSGWETWTARDTRSLAYADLHDSCLNRPDSPRYRIDPDNRPGVEVSSDHRTFGGVATVMSDLRARLHQAHLGFGLWASFPIAAHRTFSLTLHRHPDDGRDLDPAEEAYLRNLLPHLQQAVRLSTTIGRLQSRADLVAQWSGHCQTGLVLCHPDLAIDWCNAAAIEMLARTSVMSVVGGRIRCTHVADAARLREQMRAVCSGSPTTGRLVLTGEDGASLHIRIARTDDTMDHRCTAQGSAPIALTIALPAERMWFDADDVAGLFGLSRAEARLASALAGGASIAEYAVARGITLGTARVQLNRVLSKTDTQRQAELVRLVHGSCVARGSQPGH